MKIRNKILKTALLLIACFSYTMSFAQTEMQETKAALPWYKWWWLWLGILFVLGFIIVYITFKEK
ncbi:MAG: hypothetical protein EOP53_12380 [Sphingobacteriales bacterium]|nr:MAG: hypothetical protein EOP53_12380 [Sphingobacteriales bacterium]